MSVMKFNTARYRTFFFCLFFLHCPLPHCCIESFEHLQNHTQPAPLLRLRTLYYKSSWGATTSGELQEREDDLEPRFSESLKSLDARMTTLLILSRDSSFAVLHGTCSRIPPCSITSLKWDDDRSLLVLLQLQRRHYRPRLQRL